MPWVDKFLRHNPILMWLERQGLYSGSTFPGVNFALARFGEREQKLELGESDKDRREDLLDKFRSAKQARPEHISNLEVLGLSLSTMIAGSEPTSVTPAPPTVKSISRTKQTPQRHRPHRSIIPRPPHPKLLHHPPKRTRHPLPPHPLKTPPNPPLHRPLAPLPPRLHPRSLPHAPPLRPQPRTHRPPHRRHDLQPLRPRRHDRRLQFRHHPARQSHLRRGC